MTREEYYSKEYVDKIYYFCLKKTSNMEDARDLASEISLEVLTAFQKGILIDNLDAYVWTIARNRYANWANGKHRKQEKELFDMDDIVHEIPGGENIEANIILKESINQLRRELTLIESEYREILVAYYINQEKIADIAARLSIPQGTVKTKLYNGRMRLRGGIEMAREFGKLSYAPEDIEFSQSGKSANDVPDKFLWNDLYSKICKNIMVQAYRSPSTLEMLSIELGIALPYLEPFVNQMTEATILTKNGVNDKTATYETNFVIISRDARRNMIDKLESIQKEFGRLALEYLTKGRELQLKCGTSILGDYQDYEEQKYTLACRLADDMQWSIYDKRNLSFNYDTKRPNGGSWDIMGHQTYVGKDFYWIGHSCGCFEDFELNMFVTENEVDSEYDKTEILFELKTLKKVMDSGSTPLTDKEIEVLGQAVKKNKDGNYQIAFGVYRKEHNRNGLRYGIPEALYNEQLLPLWDKMQELTDDYIRYCEDVMKQEVPKRLMNQFNFCMHSIPFIRRMLVEELRERGYLKPENELTSMIGVYTQV